MIVSQFDLWLRHKLALGKAYTGRNGASIILIIKELMMKNGYTGTHASIDIGKGIDVKIMTISQHVWP